jgi:hypothetical protein
MERKTVVFDRQRMVRLQRAYERAVEGGREIFIFEGNAYLTAYAEYVLQFLGAKFGKTSGLST